MSESQLQKELIEKIPKDFQGTALAELTDRLLLVPWDELKPVLKTEETKLLDVRVFNEQAEYRAFRGNIGETFRIRWIDKSKENQEKGEYTDFYDEGQFLDIDTRASSGTNITATGGGMYGLPKKFKDLNNLKVKIRYYFKRYDQSGQAKVFDWRILGFED